VNKVIGVPEARDALAALPEETSYGGTPAPAHVYLPRSHLKALDLDTLLVTGMRGAGKTFWWSALQDAGIRRFINRSGARSRLSEDTNVRIGFGVKPKLDAYPNKDILRKLMETGVEPRTVWRTVQAWQLAPDGHPLRQFDTWPTRTAYVFDAPEVIERLFEERDAAADQSGVDVLLLFDALDRCADDWKTMYRLIRGLLQTALDMRPYRRLRVKVFLRADQVDEAEIGDFPDASKVLSSAVELSWPRQELYGLLWHLLANGEQGELFRRFLGYEWPSTEVDGQRLFSVPRELIVKEDAQRGKFHDIAGEWMGRGPKRGFPYTWIPNHLADTEGRVSPRSLLAALRTAAEGTADQPSEHPRALHYDSIKRGVQEASKIRVREIQEDYPWMHRVLEPLAGMVVPCAFGEIEQCWRHGNVLARLAEEVEQDEVKLPPRHLAHGADGVRQDLESLSIFLRMRDGRVNIPDVFRVGYGLGRRGGVKPLR
jgi:hypothetical protein